MRRRGLPVESLHKDVVIIGTDEVRFSIQMLGGFAIVYGETRITEQAKRVSKIWKMLQYLIANRNKTIPQEELIEIFCDDDVVSNPGSAIRTMVYRARGVLADAGIPDAENMIVTKNGGYRWNSAIPCVIDAEEFEALCKKAGAETDESEQLKLLLQAAELYQGDFLPYSTGEIWVLPLSRWYRSMYISCVHKAIELLTEAGKINDSEELCTKALRIDPFDETLLEHHLRALLEQGKNAEALDQYKKMEGMYYDVLGVNFSESLRTLYGQIQQPAIKDGVSLDAMLDDWLEGAGAPGAFYCDLNEFKTMYQIESRSVPRTGRTAYIVRFDAIHEPDARGGGIMPQFEKVIPATLRMGDLFTRSGPGQYLLMLHSLTYEDCKMLIDRIMYSLDTRLLSKVIGTSIKPVTPVF